MKVRVRIDGILEHGESSTLFLICGQKIVLNNSEFKKGKRNSIIVDRRLATEKQLRWKLMFHFPPYIKPIPNQVCIDELRL